jgi:hypothetical protein
VPNGVVFEAIFAASLQLLPVVKSPVLKRAIYEVVVASMKVELSFSDFLLYPGVC